MILCIENPKDTIKKLLELINEYSKVAGYKINTQKSLAFLYTNNEKTQREIKETIPFIIDQSNHMDHSLVWLNETVSHAVWGHPRWAGHGGQFWQNVVHWRREWQTTSSIPALRTPWTALKGKKNRTLKGELPTSVGAQYAIGDQWRNNTPERMKGWSQSKNNTQLWM